jgi:enamine deaminase RidA (YjgF/YER057c/UK114 family)
MTPLSPSADPHLKETEERSMLTLQPPGWPRPRGYANGIEAEGRLIFVAGQIGWDDTGQFQTTAFAAQFRQALLNTLAVLKEASAGPEQIARMTWFITSREEYMASLSELGATWKELMGRNYTAMSVIIVAGLIEPEAKIEIETTAVISSPRQERLDP